MPKQTNTNSSTLTWDAYYKDLRKDPKTKELLDKAGREIDKKIQGKRINNRRDKG